MPKSRKSPNALAKPLNELLAGLAMVGGVDWFFVLAGNKFRARLADAFDLSLENSFR